MTFFISIGQNKLIIRKFIDRKDLEAIYRRNFNVKKWRQRRSRKGKRHKGFSV